MKVIFLMPHLLHYFNLILNKLNDIPGVDLTVIIPTQHNSMVGGGGINQMRENVRFRIIEKQEIKIGPYYSFKGLSRLLIQEKPDIIITGDIFMFPFIINIPLRLVMKFLNIKLIMRSIPYQIPKYTVSFKRQGNNPNRIDKLPKPLRYLVVNCGIEGLLRRSRAYINKLIYNAPDSHLNYVDEAYDIYGSYGVPENKIFVTDNTTDTDILQKSEDEANLLPAILPFNKNRILHVGRLVKWKQVDMLIRCTANLKKQFLDVELLVIGEGPEEESLRQLAKELNIEESVIFIGGVYDTTELARYFMASSVYVLAGVGGLSINDAMFFRLPVICSICDGTEKKLVRDGYNGKFFKEGDEADLTTKISEVLGNDELKITMGKNSRYIVDNEINIHTVMAKWKHALDCTLSN